MRTSRKSSCATVSSVRLAARGWLAALSALTLAACTAEPRPRPRGVVLVCMDTVRADHLGCYGYDRHPTTPSLDALAERSILFADASATAGWTKPSVPSFLTGTYPCQHGVYEGSARTRAGAVSDVLADEAVTLAEVFRERGYRTAAFVRNAQLRAGNGFEQGFEEYREEAMDARQIRWRALDWLDSLTAGEPFFLYLHFLDAHWPYPVPDEHAARFAGEEAAARFRNDDWRQLRDAINDGELALEGADRLALEAIYDGAIRYLDDQLGQLFRGLERRGLAAGTVVAVISDHGEEFGEHGRFGHGHGLYENLLRVPWILHVPGVEPARVTTPVSLVDLFPTVLAAAGLPAAVETEGIDRLAAGGPHRPILAEHKGPDHYLQSLRQGGRKLVRRFRPPERKGGGEAPPIALGERWEAELERSAGRLRATQLKPRPEEPSEPVEIKGTASALGPAGFEIGGFEIRLRDDHQTILADGAERAVLAAGSPVKVRGAFQDGVFLAERVKLYPPGEDVALELRGPVSAVEGDAAGGRLRLGATWVLFDRRTRLRSGGGESRPRMDRREVYRALELGAEDAVRRGFAIEERLFDLVRSPAEDRPLPGGSEAGSLSRTLDRLGRGLALRRVAGGDGQRALSAETLRDLRALGYVD